MKKSFLAIFIGGFLLAASTPGAFADWSEAVKLIKKDTKRYDMVVERSSGERLLVQHHHICQTMSTEFPLKLVWDKDVLKRVEVRVNEICNVFNYAPYTSEAKLSNYIRTDNYLIKNHLADIDWGNYRYRLDYANGCENLMEFLNDTVYLSLPKKELAGGTMILPGNRGQCTIKSAKIMEDISSEKPLVPPIDGLYYQGQVNQAYFYWKDQQTDDYPLLYVVSYSRYPINPKDYHWQQMPNLQFTRNNTMTVNRLVNGLKYYFYLAAIDADGNASEWKQIEITPITPTPKLNKGTKEDFVFNIELVEENDNGFTLKWPALANADLYLVQLFVGGKPILYKYLTENQITIPKLPEYKDKGLKLTVKEEPKEPKGNPYYDGHFWWYREKVKK